MKSMMKEKTEEKEQKINLEKYIDNLNTCPFCCYDIVFTYEECTEDNLFWRYVECDRCGKKWCEKYTITSVEEVLD